MSAWLQLTGDGNASSRGGFLSLDNVTSSSSTTSPATTTAAAVAAVNAAVAGQGEDGPEEGAGEKNWWGLLAVALVLATAAGNILVCLAISRERRLQNVTNYFLMSLAITDLMVAVLVMPAGILTLITGFFPLSSAYCLAWICLDVLFCTASIMHLCTISVDRYLSLRYPMRFGRNKTRRRVTLKIVFVWLLSLAMSLPLSLMYSQDHASVLVGGTCQIPDPLYKLVGSIVSFYIPLAVMLLTYALTVRLLALQQTQLGGGGGGPGAASAPSHTSTASSAASAAWTGSGWLLQSTGLERRSTWGRFLPSGRGSAAARASARAASAEASGGGGESTGVAGAGTASESLFVPHSPHFGGPHRGGPPGNTASSTEIEDVTEDDGASSLEARDLWLTDEPTPAAVSALSHFGAEMLKLSRGLETVAAAAAAAAAAAVTQQKDRCSPAPQRTRPSDSANCSGSASRSASPSSLFAGTSNAPSPPPLSPRPPTPPPFATAAASAAGRKMPRRASTFHVRRTGGGAGGSAAARIARKRRGSSFHEVPLPRSSTTNTSDDVSEETVALETLTLPPPKESNGTSPPPASPSPSTSLKPPDAEGSASQAALGAEGRSGSTSPSSPLTPRTPRRSVVSFPLPPPCTCPYFGQQPAATKGTSPQGQDGGKRVPPPPPPRSPRANRQGSDIALPSSAEASPRANNMIVTWDRRGSSARSSLVSSTPPPARSTPALRRAATQRHHHHHHHNGAPGAAGSKAGGGSGPPSRAGGDVGSVQSSPCLLVRYGSRSRSGRSTGTVRSHHSRTSSVASRISSRHGRIIRLEQKATKVLGVVFFTFVVLWAPFFVLNLVPTVCGEECERRIDHRVFDFVTWLGYASSMVNPIFYTIFNKVFRQAFKKVLTCQYRKKVWRPPA